VLQERKKYLHGEVFQTSKKGPNIRKKRGQLYTKRPTEEPTSRNLKETADA